LSGGSILNVVHYASLKGVERFNKMKALSKMNGYDYEKSAISSSISPVQPQFGIFLTDVLEGIQREMIKEGKSFGVVA
ncbi:MAG TPA: hypothetical protein VFV08_15925, partial [Puia sp.]|nr:hypothetical protein [Puia sp.]